MSNKPYWSNNNSQPLKGNNPSWHEGALQRIAELESQVDDLKRELVVARGQG